MDLELVDILISVLHIFISNKKGFLKYICLLKLKKYKNKNNISDEILLKYIINIIGDNNQLLLIQISRKLKKKNIITNYNYLKEHAKNYKLSYILTWLRVYSPHPCLYKTDEFYEDYTSATTNKSIYSKVIRTCYI